MIPQTDLSCQIQNPSLLSWQQQMIQSVRTAAELCELLEIPITKLNLSEQSARDFPVLTPRSFIDKMEKGNRLDPLLLQVLNRDQEEFQMEGFSSDPLDESAYTKAPGLIHKYHGRALMVVSGQCAINCRYCFRRSFPYSENNPGREGWRQALDYLSKEESLSEIIFSGGDPLSAPDKHLAWMVEQLEAIPHLKRLRIHTRLPVVIPERICDELLKWLDKTRFGVQVVLHINHPNEIDDTLANAVSRLRLVGIHTLNQSVLLKSINDDLETLVELQEKAFEAGILPYYLHCLDPIQGAHHFHIPTEKALELVAQLRSVLPGYLVPRLAQEIPGKSGKTILA